MITTATTSLQNLVNVFDSAPVGYTVPKAASTSQDFSLLHGITPTWELTILAFFVFVVMVYMFTIGRDRITGLFLSAYVAWIGARYMPFIDAINRLSHQSVYVPLAVFIVLFAAIFLLLFKSDFLQSFGALSRWWQNVVFAVLFSGLFVTIVFTFLPSSFARQLSSYDQLVFISDIGRFFWTILPVIAMAFFGSGRRFRV